MPSLCAEGLVCIEYVCMLSVRVHKQPSFNPQADFMHIRYRNSYGRCGYNCEYTDGNTPYFLADYHFENADLVVVAVTLANVESLLKISFQCTSTQ